MPGRILPPPQPLNGSNANHSPSEDEEDTDSEEYESPPEVDPSLVELDSDEFPNYFSERNGRLFHSGASPYPLPVDTPEQEVRIHHYLQGAFKLTQTFKYAKRLKGLTEILSQLINGLYVGPVPEVLAPQPERRPMVLDVCTGTGRWVMDMAIQFPHVFFHGFDIVPLASRYPPRNVQFEISDVNAPGPYRWASGTFDVVHARYVDMAVVDYLRFSHEVARLLRPGGLFLSYEWSRLPEFDPSYHRDPAVDAPASTQFYNAINVALAARGVRQLASHVQDYLASTGLFSEISDRTMYVPIGAWPENPTTRAIGIACLAAQERYANSIRPLLQESGFTESDINNLVADYIQEIHTTRGLVSTLYAVFARRSNY